MQNYINKEYFCSFLSSLIGGVLHLSCPHGVTYYTTCLLWHESARDHIDAILAFFRFPTVFICDIAGKVAVHGNNRTNDKLFPKPDVGRLVEPTDANLERAESGDLEVHLDWVKNLKGALPTMSPLRLPDDDRYTAVHPVTKTTLRYVLLDRFHQLNHRAIDDILRALNICPELRSLINSSAAEQVNRQLSSSLYSFTQMTEHNFKFMLRVHFEASNNKRNRTHLESIQQRCDVKLGIGAMGTLVPVEDGL